jgi:uncharacterized protein YjiS (DUF1127 family)
MRALEREQHGVARCSSNAAVSLTPAEKDNMMQCLYRCTRCGMGRLATMVEHGDYGVAVHVCLCSHCRYASQPGVPVAVQEGASALPISVRAAMVPVARLTGPGVEALRLEELLMLLGLLPDAPESAAQRPALAPAGHAAGVSPVAPEDEGGEEHQGRNARGTAAGALDQRWTVVVGLGRESGVAVEAVPSRTAGLLVWRQPSISPSTVLGTLVARLANRLLFRPERWFFGQTRRTDGREGRGQLSRMRRSRSCPVTLRLQPTWTAGSRWRQKSDGDLVRAVAPTRATRGKANQTGQRSPHPRRRYDVAQWRHQGAENHRTMECRVVQESTMPTHRHGSVPARVWHIIRSVLAHGRATLRTWQQRRAERHHLRCLLRWDDRLLADIGLNRDAVAREARRPFWHPFAPALAHGSVHHARQKPNDPWPMVEFLLEL